MGDMDLLRPVAAAGIPCTVVARPGAPSLYSRFTRARLHWDSSQDAGKRVDALVEFGQAQSERPVLFYEGDEELLLLSRHRERLAQAFRFVIADARLVEDIVDKARFAALAKRHGLPVPAALQFHAATPEPIDLGLDFPIIIKPLTRLGQWNETFGLRKALAAESPDALRRLWPQLRALDIDLLAQQLIAGAEAQIESYHCYVDARGDIAGEFTGRKIRTYPVTYGHTTALQITDAADVRRQGRDAVERLNLTGVAKLDFKRDRAGKLHLLEINPRFTLWHHAGALAGVNIPALVYADLTGTPRPAVGARQNRRALVPRLEGFAGRAPIRRAADGMVALGSRLRGEVGFGVERPDAGRARDAASRRRAVSAAPRAGITRRAGRRRLVRLALVSDVHANLEALQATLADIAAQAADRVVCLGDIVGYNTRPAECIALIRDGKVLCVAGNHDLAVSGRITTKNFSATAARAAAWTRQRLTGDELAFLARPAAQSQYRRQIDPGARRASPRHRMRKRTAR